jgi:hypothetical protein
MKSLPVLLALAVFSSLAFAQPLRGRFQRIEHRLEGVVFFH